MSRALLYLSTRTLGNRLVSAARRLRRPRYFISFLVGAAYFYAFALRHWIDSLRSTRESGGRLPALDQMELIAALLLTAVVVLAWCRPSPPSAVAFSEAEVHFLFPAPLARPALLRWKLLRGQAGLLFGVLVVAAGLGRRAAPGGLAIFLAGLWVAFATVQVHLTAARMRLPWLESRGVGWIRRVGAAAAALLVVVSAQAACAAGGPGAIPSLPLGDPSWPAGFLGQLDRLLDGGPAFWVLLPARALVRPAFAQDAWQFFLRAPAALLLLGIHYLWVVRGRVAIEDGALEAAQTAALRRTRRAGGRGPRTYRARRLPAALRLAPTGWPETALFWKGLVALARGAGGGQTLVVMGLAFVVPMAVVTTLTKTAADVGPAAGAMCGFLGLILMMMGPAVLRADVREELLRIDLLKSYPIRGRSIIVGSVLGPVVVLTVVQWGLMAAFVLLTRGRLEWSASLADLAPAAAVALGVLAPGINLVSSLIHNGALLMVPGWLALGSPRGGGGLERFGQGIIAAFGRMAAMAVGLVPAAAAFAGCWFVASAFLGAAASLVLSSLPALAILAAEAVLGVLILGAYLERFDPAQELDAIGH